MLNFQILISNLADTKFTFLLCVVCAAILLYFKKNKEVLEILFSATTALFITFILKHLTKIPRPENMQVFEDGYRFPSGHATMAGVVSSLIFYFTYTKVKNKFLRYFLYCLSFIWVILVSYSRIFLQVHYFIDVFTGAAIGIFSTILVIKIFKHLHYYK